MKNKLSPFTLLSPGKLKVLLSLGFKGYLADKGWFKAYETKSAIDENGNPIPWVTYSFIDFIKTRINKSQDVFEFGSGNSTLFYAKSVKSIVSVENDREWFNIISKQNLKNSKIIYCQLDRNGKYAQSALNTNQKFHITIVDGRDRVNCCKQAIHSLTEDGVIILDDSERKEYSDAVNFLTSMGFKSIPFSGMAPGTIVSKCTSVFYKSENCLGI